MAQLPRLSRELEPWDRAGERAGERAGGKARDDGLRGRPALAVILAVILAAAAGCRGERVAECDAMLAIVEEVGACGRLDATQRAQIDQALRSIREALDRLEDVGPGRAPADLLNEAKATCTRQEAAIRQLYQKDAPECLW